MHNEGADRGGFDAGTLGHRGHTTGENPLSAPADPPTMNPVATTEPAPLTLRLRGA